MRIIADTHIHLYPTFQTVTALRVLARNLGELAGDAVRVGVVVDRHACSGFASVRDYRGSEMAVSPASDGLSVRVDLGDGTTVHLVAGCQVATAERLEVLGLGCRPDLPDGVPADEAIGRIREAGGLPVLQRALGKWTFARGRIVGGLFDRFSPSQLTVGDSTLCTDFTGEGRLTALARQKGYCILAGSDPLPSPGEEQVMGTYASLWDVPALADDPPVGTLLPPRQSAITAVGRRSGALRIVHRLARHKLH